MALYFTTTAINVALLAEGVDRNLDRMMRLKYAKVALLAEGVDRHSIFVYRVFRAVVALLAEGVDRNTIAAGAVVVGNGRPPRGGRG